MSDHRPIAGQVVVRHGDAHALRGVVRHFDTVYPGHPHVDVAKELLARVEQVEDSVSDRFRDRVSNRNVL